MMADINRAIGHQFGGANVKDGEVDEKDEPSLVI
jgi:hypothetical protein